MSDNKKKKAFHKKSLSSLKVNISNKTNIVKEKSKKVVKTIKTSKVKIGIGKKKLVLPAALFFIAVFMIALNASYAFFTTQTSSKNYVVYTGNLQVDFEHVGNVIEISNAVPMTNSRGILTDGYSFRVANNGTIEAKYQVRLEVESDVNTTDKTVEYIPLEYMKMAYTTDGTNYSEPVRLSDLDQNLVFVTNQVIAANAKDNYTIKLWIDYSAPTEIENKVFKARIVVDAIQNQGSTNIIADAAPIINLKKDTNGNTDINLIQNATYTELGVESVIDDLDKLDKSNVTMTYEYFDGTNITTVQSINTATTGVYYVTYQITDSGNNTGYAVRVVTVNPTETLPTITLVGDNPDTAFINNTYTDLGVTVQNNNKVVTLGEVKTSAPGTYIVKYIVIDENNNMNSVTRTVNVISSLPASNVTTTQGKTLQQAIDELYQLLG